MRVLKKNEKYFELTGSIENHLDEVSEFCYISDLPLDEYSKEFYYHNGDKVYKSAYKVHKELKLAFENREIDFNDIINPFQDKLKENIYLDNSNNSKTYKGFTHKGNTTIDLLERKFHRTFIDDITTAYTETKAELEELKKNINLMEVNNDEDFKRLFIKHLKLFLKNAYDRHLVSVRATEIYFNINYKDIIDKVEQDFLPKVSQETVEAYKIKKAELESELLKNKLFKGRLYLHGKVIDFLEMLRYDKALHVLKSEDVYIDLQNFIYFVSTMLQNQEHFSWKIGQKIYDTLNIKDILLDNFSDFANLGITEEQYLDIKRKLSCAQKYLSIKEYDKALSNIQWFMEAYLKAVGAATTRTGKIESKINEKVKNALNDENKLLNIKHLEIIESFKICFAYKETKVCTKYSDILKSMDSKYLPVNTPRNELVHDGTGLSEEDFKTKLGYLLKDEFVKESDFLRKWYTLFGLPTENIFDTINQTILKGVLNPDSIRK